MGRLEEYLRWRTHRLRRLSPDDIEDCIVHNTMDDGPTQISIHNIYRALQICTTKREIEEYIVKNIQAISRYPYYVYVGKAFPDAPDEAIAYDIGYDLGPLKIYIYSPNVTGYGQLFWRDYL
uniref:Uncharacterized protein n=1 Tax=Acrobeloides nanus TaxID=290746 RepID=A0A914EKA1_9BILA